MEVSNLETRGAPPRCGRLGELREVSLAVGLHGYARGSIMWSMGGGPRFGTG